MPRQWLDGRSCLLMERIIGYSRVPDLAGENDAFVIHNADGLNYVLSRGA